MGVGDYNQIQAGIYQEADGDNSSGYTCQCDGFWTLEDDWIHGDIIVSHLGQSGYMLGSSQVSGLSKLFISTFDDLTSHEDTIT